MLQDFAKIKRGKKKEIESESESDQVSRSNHQFKPLSFIVICYAARDN